MLKEIFICHSEEFLGHLMLHTGKKWSGHHDTYRSDKIVELAADVGISPFSSIPENLSTCIATKEPLGIIPVPEKLLKNLVLKEERSLPMK